LHHHQNIDKSFYHFSFLKDTKVNGIYYNAFAAYLKLYPFIKTPHSHDFYSVILFTKGKGSIRINNDSYTVQPQTICLIAPHQVHSFMDLDDVEGIIFFFCQDFYIEEFSFIRLLNIFSYTSQIEQSSCNPSISLTDQEFKIVMTIINSVQYEYESYKKGNNSAVIIRSFLNIMLLKISELYEARSGKSTKTDSILIHSLSHMVDTYFIQEQQVGFYTSAFNISEKQLNDLCNTHFKCGLKKIIQTRLMQEARKLLLSSELSVAEIAYKLNFDDNSYFNKVFKNKTGLTPKRFRGMHKRLVP